MAKQLIPQTFYLFASDQGNGVGNINANGDYSVTPDTFFIAPADGVIMRLERLVVHIEDNGNLTADSYGAVNTLTNGIEIKVIDQSSTVLDLTSAQPIQSNSDWGKFCYDVNFLEFGSGNNFVQIRWTFSRAGFPLRLVGDNDDAFTIDLNDNLSGLVTHTFQIQGYYETQNWI